MGMNFRKAAVVLLVLTSLVSLVGHWRYTMSLNTKDAGSEALDIWEARLEPARHTLPVERGMIGFLGEWDVAGMEFSPIDQEAEFLLSQYSLAPFILVRGPRAEWNVAVLSPKAYKTWEQSNQGDFEVIALRHNVYLLHRLKNP
jgi:hypothetical protein